MQFTGKLRRIVLERQGLLHSAPFGRGLRGTLAAIERLGYVQIDTISVVQRAHDHVLAARVPDYAPAMLDALQASGRVFEYWAHAAAYLPTSAYRFALPRMQAMRRGEERWIRCRDPRLMRRVLARIRAEGPLMARDFEAPAGKRGGWWDWKPAKQALEQLFMQGDLMVVGRQGFQKRYDLTERVLPADVDTRPPSLDEFASHLVAQSLASHGCASVGSATYQLRTPGLRAAVSTALVQAQEAGTVIAADARAHPRGTDGPEGLYVSRALLDARTPAASARVRILSPFDNVIIQRQRGRSLFDFDYQLECYLPEHKRRFGYFCLPLLYRDRFFGRADCKVHRLEGRLEIRALFVEHPLVIAPDGATAVSALARALWALAGSNGCDQIGLCKVDPISWLRPLRQAIDATGYPPTITGQQT